MFINTGDSRGIISCNGGKKVIQTTLDHKPICKNEQERIFGHGGQLYR